MGRATRNTVYRGNPEQKLIKLRDDFSGGVNLRDSDELMNDNELRYGYNLRLDEQGDINSRNGWERLPGMDLLLQKGYDDFHDIGIGINVPITPIKTQTIKTQTLKPGQSVSYTLGDLKYLIKTETLYFRGYNRTEVIEQSVQVKLYERGKFIQNLSEKTVVKNKDDQTLFPIKITDMYRQGVTDDGQVRQARLVFTFTNTTNKDITVEGTLSGDIWRDKPNGEVTKVQDILYFDVVENKNQLWEYIVSSTDEEILPGYAYDSGSCAYLLLVRNNDSIFAVCKRFTYDTTKGLVRDNAKFIDISKLAGQYEHIDKVDHLLDKPLNLVNSNVGKLDGKHYFTITGKLYDSDNKKQYSNLISIEYMPHRSKLIDAEVYGKIDGASSSATNKAYKPTPQEIRHVGFNMLGSNPLEWIDNAGITFNSIQGVFLTTKTGDKPINVIPMEQQFSVRIMYTGTINDREFEIKFYETVGYDDDKKAPKRNEIKATVSKRRASFGMYIADVQLKTAPSQEVEIEIKFPDDTNVGTYYDYYNPGQIDPDVESIRALDIGNYEIEKVWDRFVYYKDDTMWYNDINRPDYIPNFNYIKLPIDSSDAITKIIFFRSSYIIFTKKKIFKMQGSFVDGLSITLVNDTLGCVAPKTVQMVGNKLIFLSGRGLYALKSELFRQDLENVERLDAKIPDVIPTQEHLASYVIDDEYVLLLNNHRQRLQDPNHMRDLNMLSRHFRMPDVVRYYTESEAFMFEVYDNEFPWFIFGYNGEMFGVNKGAIYKGNSGPIDFGHNIPIYLETQGMDFEYPTHEKKYKKMTIKLGVDSFLEDIAFDFYVDGTHSYEKIKWNSHLYDEIDLENSRHLIERIRIPSRKGKNLAIIMTANTTKHISLKALSFEYKLGKIRE